MVDVSILEALWCHVVESAGRHTGRGEDGRVGAQGVRYSEIYDVDEVGRRHQDVGWFDISMYQSVRVRGVQCLGDLADEVDGAGRCNRPLPFQNRVDALTVDQPHVDEQPALQLAEIMDRYDVRFPEPGSYV
jgi:hypothetical protein